mgnify:CR=1 FL=1
MSGERCVELGGAVGHPVDLVEHRCVVGRGAEVRVSSADRVLGCRVVGDPGDPVAEGSPGSDPRSVVAVGDRRDGGEHLSDVAAAAADLSEHVLDLEVEAVVAEELLRHADIVAPDDGVPVDGSGPVVERGRDRVQGPRAMSGAGACNTARNVCCDRSGTAEEPGVQRPKTSSSQSRIASLAT